MARAPLRKGCNILGSPPAMVTVMVEKTTSNNGLECTTVWWHSAHLVDKPLASLQIYIVRTKSEEATETEPAPDEDSNSIASEALGRRLIDKLNHGSGVHNSRLDIYTLQIPPDTSPTEKIARCVGHQRAEIAARQARGRELFMQSYNRVFHYAKHDYHHFFVIVESDMDAWDDEGVIFVRFDPVPGIQDRNPSPPEIDVTRHVGLKLILSILSSVRSGTHTLWQGIFSDDDPSQEELSKVAAKPSSVT